MENTEMVPTAESPAEVAFRRGCQALEDDYPSAAALFEEAARLSGPEMLWRITEENLNNETATTWMRRAVVTESEPGGISVDPGTLPIEMYKDSYLRQRWEVAVESDDRARTLAALEAAAERMQCVMEDGTERSPQEIEEILTDLYNPDEAAVHPWESIPRVWLDCGDAMIPIMARTHLRIIADELRKAGIRQARLYTPEPSTDDD